MNEQSALTDDQLIAQSLHNDHAAFGALVLRYRSAAIGVAYRICGDMATAEDIAQLTFIRIWEKLHTFRPGSAFRPWLHRIAANLTIDTLRRSAPTVDVEQFAMADSRPSPEGEALNAERAAAVRAAVMKLPLQSRAALVLREYEELSYQEIADALDIPLGTVKSRINDARCRLRAELRDVIERDVINQEI